MLKTKKIAAVSIELTGGVEAVFVQEGDSWNGLREYRCISPAAFAGSTIITAPDPSSGGPISLVLDDLFGRLQQSIIVMASPTIAAEMKAAHAATEKSTQP